MTSTNAKFYLVAALFAGVLVAACGKGSDGAKPDPEQVCQVATLENGGKYKCPDGYFCKYDDGVDMLQPNATGTCQMMQMYKPCQSLGPCSANYEPKCTVANARRYCDLLNDNLRCRCYFPGSAVEGEMGDEVKLPTTTE